MNPHQQNKVDISSLSPDEQRLFRLYGKLPNKKDVLQNKLKERKYFDSGDYALSKAGKASDIGVMQIGREHPNQKTSRTPLSRRAQSRSPVKEREGSFLQRQTSVDEVEDGEEGERRA
ncbi:hypothetical protein H2199_004708 [Coniosporium tulheliwenetii]|uniref:Uncharacterized protein n=1 Tax=Coniosporium tulheliwenetii TaxID=3383036 RepID=A0ACC2Z553_9PEZI|nr:hypothetical protein H2199_004708 [Cladosporium sp. JES 115]